jgi:nicotinamidase-related amidase
MSYATNCPICLVIVDYQNDIIGGLLEKDRINLLKSTKAAINAARARAIPIIFVKVAFRPGYPEVNIRNKMFAGIVKQNVLTGKHRICV